jgi:hypothetical protein
MRLTLRTLLAWLDTVLPPDDQKALGEKVATSPVVPQLIARIRDVVERAALSAPRPDGKGLADDANSVAEYLDNTLSSDRLEAFERICIESDMHLAEAAACHGLLAEISREPGVAGPLDAAGRRRLLEAIRHRVTAPPGGFQHESEVSNARALQAALVAAGDGEACDTVLGSVPVVVRQPRAKARGKAPLGAWISAITAAALLAMLGGFFLWSLGRDRGRKVAVKPAADLVAAVPQKDAGSPPAAAAAAGPVDRGDGPDAAEPVILAAPPEPVVEAAASPVVAVPVDQPVDAADREPAGPAEATVMPERVAGAAPAEQPRVPQGDALAIAAAPSVVPPAGSPPNDRPAAPAVAPPVEGEPSEPAVDAAGFVSGPALLLHKLPVKPAVHGHSGWAALAANKPLAMREELLAPPFCRPEINVEGVAIRLEPNTRATLARDIDGTPRLEIVFGRAVVRSSAAKARLGITAGGLVGIVTEGLRDPVGVEVALERAAGSDPAAAPARVRASLSCSASGLAWQQSQPDGSPVVQPLQGIELQGPLPAQHRLAWDSLDSGAVAVQSQRTVPDWIAAAPRPDRLDQAAAEAVAAKATSDPLEKGLRELVDDKRGENRMAAVATLALLGDYDDLVQLLCAESGWRKLEDKQWSRLVDMTVPLALARGANAAAKLGRSFADQGPKGKGSELFALACGFDDESLAAGAAARLVEELDEAELVVRRFAIRNIVEIAQPSDADRARYRPDRPKDLRRESIGWWRQQQENGRIRRPGAAGQPK